MSIQRAKKKPNSGRHNIFKVAEQSLSYNKKDNDKELTVSIEELKYLKYELDLQKTR
jgi:F0F1-type ATP synthase membrane subunit b/b'